VPEKPPLPEEIAPTGPKLTRFRILPGPPIRPHLFADEARFALRLSIMVGATELATWACLVAAGREKAIFALAGLRLLRPLWSWLGTRVPRPAVAGSLLGAALLACIAPPHLLWLVGLPALGDLCSTCIADSVTVERRASAYAWLDMAQGLGAALGFGLAAAWPAAVLPAAAAALTLAFVGVRDLHDRGTPRSTWPLSLKSGQQLGAQLAAVALLCGSWVVPLRVASAPIAFLWPLLGMAVGARAEALMPNAVWLPRIAAAVAAAGKLWPPLRPFAAGMAFVAIPAAIARGAGEMERPVVSSLAWNALIAGAAVGAVL
jgi:hypothetical protein